MLLTDIRASLDRILDYTAEVSEDEFRNRPLLQDAVLHRIVLVGEAVKALPNEIRSRRPDVEWESIAGMRDILVHEYFRVDLDLTWQVVQREIPALRNEVDDLLEESGTGSG